MSKNFTIHDLPFEERPRERLLNLGERALSSQELLQVIRAGELPANQLLLQLKKLFRNSVVWKKFLKQASQNYLKSKELAGKSGAD